MQEFVAHSWYDYAGGKDKGLHPWDGETKFNYDGPKPPYQQLDVDKSYSWLKSPRWKGHSMEVGPLARMLMLYATGNAQAKELVDMTLAKLEVPVEALFSTLGRTAARTLETKIMADAMQGWYDQLIANIKAGDTDTFDEAKWDPKTLAEERQGRRLHGGPARRAVALDRDRGRQDRELPGVVPTTWNAGPRDAEGKPGAYEAALQGHQMHDPHQPIEILRTIHSFDPCLACAVHVTDPNGEELVQVKVSPSSGG